jgi:hypothetical protein
MCGSKAMQWVCPIRKGRNFSPHLLAGKFSRTVPGQGWRCWLLQQESFLSGAILYAA